jgi:DNA-binding response OmpR family regulator
MATRMTTQVLPQAAVLIVEDDENLRLTLADNLEDEGYAVDHHSSASAALEAARERDYEVVILDIMLPDIDGYAVCRKLRQAGCRAGILMLTARTLEDDLVAGFDAGADDYLAKPYRLRELLARVGALLRRHANTPPAQEENLGGIRIDRRARKVYGRDGAPVELTRTEFDLLTFLFDHASEALSRERILEEVWGTDVVVDPRTVDNFVSSLKRKLHWEPGCGFAVRAVRGVGYRLELDEA